MRSWRPFLRLLSLSWSETLQYRGDLVLWLTAITATPLLSLAIWYSVSASNQALLASDILTYYLLIIFIRIITLSGVGYELIQYILNGQIVMYLIRPPAIYWQFVTSVLTTKLFQLLLPLPIFILALVFWPDYFSAQIYQLDNFLLFLPSLLLATLLSFVFDLCLGLLAFWLEDAFELMAYRFLLTQATSGVIIPFSLMPVWLHSAFSLLPFRYMLSVPAEILLGQAAGSSAWQLIGWQSLWVIIFIICSRQLYLRGLKRYAIPGQ